mgnify:CR=1 FL=1
MRLDLEELAGGNCDPLTRFELVCLYPLLCADDLEILLKEYGTAYRAAQQLSLDTTHHRCPVATGGKSFFIWVLTGKMSD